MAIKHIRHLTSLIPENERPKLDNTCIKQEDGRCIKRDECSMCPEKFYMGYKEGTDEVKATEGLFTPRNCETECDAFLRVHLY